MAVLQIAPAPGIMSAMQRAALGGLTGDLVAFNQLKNRRRALGQHGVHPLTHGLSKGFKHLLWRFPQSGVHQTHIATRAAVPDCLGLYQSYVYPCLCNMQGCRQSGEPSTDDGHVTVDRPFKSLQICAMLCCFMP